MKPAERNAPPFTRSRGTQNNDAPPTLIVWGPRDGYMPEGSAKAYLRDLPSAELHVLEGGHWLLETHLHEVAGLIRPFLRSIAARPD
ncbi:alpha/beta fold hydrolase [Sphingomonas psychrotolerans]|uniref:alpha/beta fold hydrolase n=1 Tax=Sphingomonas psychrotolerans TaxID=1327635 RepID=UPI0018F4CA59|nr:alpha/beta hydrolase [Sphingomonas psychrotolerans]